MALGATTPNFISSSPLAARAYDFAKKAHEGQRRATGEPYINHAVETAKTVSAWKLDENAIAAALLHDVAEDTNCTLDDVQKEFGDEIVFLVAGITKLGKIKYRGIEAQIENMRKMVLAMAEDIRVVLIKLADRLHNMKTLSVMPNQKQKRIALETAEIYAPLAYRLGMQNLSGHLRDLAMPFLNPKEYGWLLENVKDHYESRVAYLERVKPTIESSLRENGIHQFRIDFRAKRYSSLYNKLLRYNMDIDSIYDLVALRLIVPSVNDCYAALGVIHSLWPPMPGRIKDYIAMPKPNGYRSIHTTVFCFDNKITEFQIRTQQMHEEGEFGIAAHWAYKEHKSSQELIKNAQELTWVKQLRQWQEHFSDSKQFMESLKIDFFRDRIFVVTPRGEVIDLPAGATPIDFAYRIHTEVGNSCVGAKINGKIVPLEFELRSGDVVHILTQKNKKPSESWLRFAKTAAARDHIRGAVRTQKRTLLGMQPRKIVEFKIAAGDRIGLLKDVCAVFAASKINIVKAQTVSTASMPLMKIQCEIKETREIEKMLIKLKRLKEIKEVGYRYV